jgi:hypothetical protein
MRDQNMTSRSGPSDDVFQKKPVGAADVEKVAVTIERANDR